MANPAQQRPAVGDDYVLATGVHGKERLHLLDRVYRDTTHRALLAAGLAPGMRVVDIGCGVGDVTCWVAARVGPNGHVTGLDASADQVGLAVENAAARGLANADFTAADAYQTGLPRASFDIVFCRYLLCHLARVQDGLREMHALLKPGGTLVCVEPDWASVTSEPPSDEYRRFVEVSCAGGAMRGADFRIAVRVHSHLRDVGFRDINVHFEQPAYLSGEEKRFAEITMLEAAPAFVRAGLITPDELARLADALAAVAANDASLVVQARVAVARATRA
ncbi:MAG TPA: methyltransferase domain-containing protein [Gemmatimonadaceae bacterium]